jgi:hypothetical protein
VADTPSPFITVDETKTFTVPQTLLAHVPLMSALESQRKSVSVSLGLISRIQLALPPATESKILIPLTTQQLLPLLAPNAPDLLVRSVSPTMYLLGVHSYEGNQPLLILKTESYEQAFSGMLAWETYMRPDLLPLFNRIPPQHIEEGTATTTATSTPTVVQTGFIDRVVENHDARVLENSAHDILLLWTFLDRNTLVITTNESTLREIISRVKNAPITPTP